MPTYEYECTRCGHAFERFQTITEEPVKRCPRCRGKVRRLIGVGSGILFRGSGFHETDYRSRNYREEAKKEKEDTGLKGAKKDKKEGKKTDSSSKSTESSATS